MNTVNTRKLSMGSKLLATSLVFIGNNRNSGGIMHVHWETVGFFCLALVVCSMGWFAVFAVADFWLGR